jgi:hypothetical protein
VEFIKEDCGNTAQFRIIENHAGEHTFGDNLDPCLSAYLGFHAHAVTNGFAGTFAKFTCHTPGGGPRCEAPWFQDKNLAVTPPRSIQKRERYACRFAGAWFCNKNSVGVCLKR